MSRRISPVIASLLPLFCLCLQFTNATITDTIRPGQSLNTSGIIVSANGRFGLGFVAVSTTKFYLVIACMNISCGALFWTANREHPIQNSSALLTLNLDGNLVISDGSLSHVLTNTSGGGGNDTYARLLDTGNLILTNRASDVLWQSFDFPTDTLLPGMKLKDAKTGWSLTSGKSPQDPAPGLFSLHLGSKKELILMEGSEPYWTSSLVGDLAAIFVIDGDYITWRSNYSNKIITIELDISGNLVLHTWMEGGGYWRSYNLLRCGAYPVCGAFSICNETADDEDSRCGCLQGFKRGTTGCERKTELKCRNASNNIKAQKDWFLQISQVFLPKYPLRLDVGNVSECKTACLNNCSCTGCAYDQEHRCQLWVGPLLNLKHFSADNLYKTDFYLKLAPPEGTNATITATYPRFETSKVSRNNQLWKFVLPTTSIVVVVTLGLFVYYVRRKLKRKGEDLLLLDLGMTLKANNSEHGDNRKSEVQMPLFSFASVAAATDNFSAANKLGEGGFGPVYKEHY